MIMASPSELSLDCNRHSYSMLLKSFGDSPNTASHQLHPPFDPLQTHKLEEHLSRLEEERLKIDAFKRELPLCMQLLSNAVEASRQQLQSYRATSGNQGIKRPILEEFIPMKHSNSEGPPHQLKTPNTTSDKANWMTSAQLWSQAEVGATAKQLESLPSQELEMGFSPKLSLLDENNNNNKKQRNGGAFLPFTKERNGVNAALSDLALAPNEREMEDKKGSLMSESGFLSENSTQVSNGIVMIGKTMDSTIQANVNGSTTTNNTTTATQANRKQRRCWSPDLHRRFVNALQMLGGSQVATPKQIRELMKVDGLTNDEVKSHLQKYRLHTRRPGPSPQGVGATGPQLVVLGGIWVPQEYATAAAHHHGVPPPTIYTAQPTAQVGPHYYPSAMPQAAIPQLHHHQLHFYKASSQGQSSPEFHGGRGARDRSESIEDGKSESSSGEECNERKKLASKREGEEESNGSEIILKF